MKRAFPDVKNEIAKTERTRGTNFQAAGSLVGGAAATVFEQGSMAAKVFKKSQTSAEQLNEHFGGKLLPNAASATKEPVKVQIQGPVHLNNQQAIENALKMFDPKTAEKLRKSMQPEGGTPLLGGNKPTQLPSEYINKALPSLMKGLPDKTEQLLKKHESPNSIATYDQTSETLLNKMLEIMKGEGGGTSSNTSFMIDTRALDDSVQKFSQSIGQLETLMGNPLGITVGGTITMDVKLNGAEWFRDAESSLMALAGQQVTQGINNFIRNGLKDSRVLTEPDWVNTSTEVGVPLNNNTAGLA